jgi:hypothetical protein
MVSSCKTLKGELYGEMNPRDAMPKLLSMYEAGTIKLDELVIQKYKLDDINEAMKDLRRQEHPRRHRLRVTDSITAVNVTAPKGLSNCSVVGSAAVQQCVDDEGGQGVGVLRG